MDSANSSTAGFNQWQVNYRIGLCMELSDIAARVYLECRSTSTAFDLTSQPFHVVAATVPFIIDIFLGYVVHLVRPEDCDAVLYHHHHAVLDDTTIAKSCLERHSFSFHHFESAMSHEGKVTDLLHYSYSFPFSYWEEVYLVVVVCCSLCSPKTLQLLKEYML